jgi:hypothetical protein
MAERQARDAIILSKAEVTYGTDPVPTGGANALQVSGFSFDPITAQNVPRELLRGFMGGFEELVGDRYIAARYGVEAVGSGTVATAPAWGPQMLACGFAETLTATFRADYTLTSTGFGSLTNYYHDSGVKHISTGTRGTFDLRLELGDRPMLDFTMMGLYNNETAAAQPSGTFTAFLQPEAITNAFSGDIVLGCTHTTGVAPVLTGGTTYPSKGLRISLGNRVSHSPLLNDEGIIIADRSVTGEMTLKLTAAQEVTLMGNVRNNTLTSIGFTHGTVANRKLLVFMPYCQLVNPRKAEDNGQRLITFGFRAIPSVGNDELRIVTSF